MRGITGFVLLNAWLLLVGAGVLRSAGLLARAPRRPRLVAVGPAVLAGIAVLGPLLCVLLVIGIPLTLPVVALAGAAVLGVCELPVRRRERADVATEPSCASGRMTWALRGVIALWGAFAIYVAYAFARAPTRGDDARIWSLRGLTLAYYHGLQPEIFLNPAQAGGHPAYPLFQPVLEALLSEAMGAPQLRLYHTEVWLLVICAVWTAAFLIGRRAGANVGRWPMWLAPLALFVLTPISFRNVYIGDADITGSVLLAVGAVALALWLDRDDRVCLMVGAIMLTAAASTKDEDFLAAMLLLLTAGVFFVVRDREAMLRARPGFRPAWPWLVAVAWFAAFVLPWRVWLALHHLSDSVQPPLPRALSPVYFIDRHRIKLVITAMLQQTFEQWGWLAAIFLVTCAVSIVTRAARRLAAFYLIGCGAIVITLIWLYVTTPLSLGFLLPTSMDRTVGVFMVTAGLATAHLLAKLLVAPE